MKSSKFKVQSSNKLQIPNSKFWPLMLDLSLFFDVWCLDFAAGVKYE